MLHLLSTHARTHARTHAHTHTHTRLMALCPWLPGSAGTRKAKPIWILLKQETVSGSGISWAICKSAHRSRQITMPAQHRSVFLQARCPSCSPTNSVKALKALHIHIHIFINTDLIIISRQPRLSCCPQICSNMGAKFCMPFPTQTTLNHIPSLNKWNCSFNTWILV